MHAVGAVIGLAALVAVTATAGGAAEPAELPPAGFAGHQYVDSAGCVFVRDGAAWTVRRDRQGQPLCGYVPSYPDGVPEPDEAAAESGEAPGDTAPSVPESAAVAPARQSAAPGAQAAAVPQGRAYFAQTGAFARPANAERVARALRDMGLPVLIVEERLGGSRVRTVLAGPFGDRAALDAALRQLRRNGFADAFRRRQPVQIP